MLTREYTTLFNAITDAIEILVTAQQEAEEIFISKEAVLPFEVPSHECNTHSDMSCSSQMQSFQTFQTECISDIEHQADLDQ